MSDFDEVVFTPHPDMGARGGKGWATRVTRGASGVEQRVGMWSMPLRTWEVGYSLRSIPVYQSLDAFHTARQGMLRGFRYDDFIDNDSSVGGVATKQLTLQLTTTTFQLRKAYGDSPQIVYLKVSKPVGDDLTDTDADASNSTVRIYDAGGAPVASGWTVNLTNGVVTFSGAPGYVPFAEYDYHIPVRFGADRLAGSLDEITFGSFQGVQLQELRL